MSPRRKLALLAVVLAQLAVPLALAGLAAADLAFGQEIRLRAQPVDPLDVFRGNYVVLRYDVSSLPVNFDVARGDRICTPLRETGRRMAGWLRRRRAARGRGGDLRTRAPRRRRRHRGGGRVRDRDVLRERGPRQGDRAGAGEWPGLRDRRPRRRRQRADRAARARVSAPAGPRLDRAGELGRAGREALGGSPQALGAELRDPVERGAGRVLDSSRDREGRETTPAGEGEHEGSEPCRRRSGCRARPRP